MKLITQAIIDKFIKVGRQDKPDAEIVVKYFHPMSNWTWYATAATFLLKDDREGDAETFAGQKITPADIADIIFFGMVHGYEKELGSFALSELAECVIRRLPMERDLYFEGKTLLDI